MKKNLIIVTVSLALLFIGFLLWKAGSQNQSVPQESHVSSDRDNDNQANNSKTLDDLLSQAEEIQLPKVDTTGWQTYRNENMGIEFMYPKGWATKEHFGNRLCVETEDGRYAKMPGSLAQRLQGEECIVQIDKYLTDDISFSDTWVKQNADSSFLKPMTEGQGEILLIKDSSRNYVYVRIQGKIFYLSAWNENLSLDKTIPSVFYGILQTIKPLKN